MVLDKRFKEAIRYLPSDEKDKLIFRLLKKDSALVNRLCFELVSCDSKEDRREQAKKGIENRLNEFKRHADYSTPGIMMMEMREASGIINEHVKTTKDKYGEVYLHLFLLQEFLKVYNDFYKDSSPKKSYTLNIYCIARAFKVMILLKKMHEDLQFDFVSDITKTGRLFGDNPLLMNAAVHNGFNINWLILNEIPENIEKIEKELREQGYLK